MKLRLVTKLLLLTCCLSGFAPVAQAFYHPDTGRWLSRDPLGEAGFEVLGRGRAKILGDDPNRYMFVGNDPVSQVDYLGLKKKGKNWEKLTEAAETAALSALPGGEFVAALKVFDGCNSVGLALAWNKTKYNDCYADALLGDPKKSAAAEKACEQKWGDRIKLLQGTYDAHCRKRSCYTSFGMG